MESVAEGIGTVREVWGSEALVEVDSDSGSPLPSSFPPFFLFNLDVTYAGQPLPKDEVSDLIDLTQLYFVNEKVSFEAEWVRGHVFGRSRQGTSFGSPLEKWIVKDVTALKGMANPEDNAPIMEDEIGTVHWVDDSGWNGIVLVDRWGELPFERRMVCVESNWTFVSSAKSVLKKGRTVKVRTVAVEKLTADYSIVSLSPLGKMYSCEAVVTEVKEHAAFAHSLAFGKIYIPYRSFVAPKEFMDRENKRLLFDNLYGLKVNVTLLDSLPHRTCPWRAVSVLLPYQNITRARESSNENGIGRVNSDEE